MVSAVTQSLHAVLTIQDLRAESALRKAEMWCETISCPAPDHGIFDAHFAAPPVAAQPFPNTFAVTIRGTLTYADDPASHSDTEKTVRREQWERSACRVAHQIEGLQVLRFTPSRL